MKIVKVLEESYLLIKGVSVAVENELKEQKVEFLSMLAAALASSLLRKLLMDNEVIRAGEETIRAGEGTNRPGQDL